MEIKRIFLPKKDITDKDKEDLMNLADQYTNDILEPDMERAILDAKKWKISPLEIELGVVYSFCSMHKPINLIEYLAVAGFGTSTELVRKITVFDEDTYNSRKPICPVILEGVSASLDIEKLDANEIPYNLERMVDPYVFEELKELESKIIARLKLNDTMSLNRLIHDLNVGYAVFYGGTKAKISTEIQTSVESTGLVGEKIEKLGRIEYKVKRKQ